MAERSSNKQSIIVGITVLALLLILGVWSIFRLIKHEHQRDLSNWQITLGVMADSKTAGIQKWLDSQFEVLQELSENGSLQLYTKHLMQSPNETNDIEPAQLEFLRNLIYATAERAGFMDTTRSTSPIKANIAFQAAYSLALVDRNSSIITATPGASIPDTKLIKTVKNVLKNGTPALYDLHLNAKSIPIIGFIVPVFSLQVEKGHKEAIGALVGMKHAGQTLFPLLKSTGIATKTDEAFLIRQDDNLITYLSPLADNTAAMQRQLAADEVNLAGAFAMKFPGSFALLRDYNGKNVLTTSRVVSGLSTWILVQKIDVSEALKESSAHQKFLLTAMLFCLLLITTLIIAAWWHGSSLRHRKYAQDLMDQSEKVQSQAHLLDAINNNIADYIFLLDEKFNFIFINNALADRMSLPSEDIVGKSLTSTFGAAPSKQLLPLIENCLAENTFITQEIDLEINAAHNVYLAKFTPVPYKNKSATLINLHDITELQKGQKRQAHLLEQLIKALMRSIDIHDPYSSNHSAKTAEIAGAIASSMNLEAHEHRTIKIAANLCNLGKLFIPKEILTKAADLTDSEKDSIRREAEYTADILKGIDFDGPVLETIIQKNEYIDGTGHPQGLKGDDIILSARILAVANAFVAMISPRAYRDKFPTNEAVNKIIAAADTQFDRQVTAALFHVVENMIDWDTWRKNN